jgi:hypothetical protein
MNHLSEEDLILHYYGEEGDPLPAEQHLDSCEGCRRLYASLQRVLNVVDSLPVPERGANYGDAVWQRIESRLPARRRWLALSTSWRWAAAAAAFAALLVAAFLAGRAYPRREMPAQMASGEAQPDKGILLVAVGDYLERSQMVLTELANANSKGPIDISTEQERASDLVSESRLYRQTAVRAGDERVAGLLDDLDRILLEISHLPSQISPADQQKLRQRFEAEGILFKIRVLGSSVRNEEKTGREATTAPGQKL